MGATSQCAAEVETVNAEFAQRADEIERRAGQRPPTLAPATPKQEAAFTFLAEAFQEAFDTKVVPFSDAEGTAPNGFAKSLNKLQSDARNNVSNNTVERLTISSQPSPTTKAGRRYSLT